MSETTTVEETITKESTNETQSVEDKKVGAKRYDPEIIIEFADILYARANSVIAFWFFVGLLAGGGIGALVGSSNYSMGSEEFMMSLGIGAVSGCALGYYIGNGKAFFLKLKAQLTLCQLQIEVNTR